MTCDAVLRSALALVVMLTLVTAAPARPTRKMTYPVTLLAARDVEVFLACHDPVERALTSADEDRDERLRPVFAQCGFKGSSYSDWRVLFQSIRLGCNDYNASSIRYVVKDGMILGRSKGSVMSANRRVLVPFKSRLSFFCRD